MKRSNKLPDQHNCELNDNKDEEFLWTLPPNAGYLAKWWEATKRHIIVSPNHIDTKDYFRSKAAISKERRRHLLTRRYRNIIHPFSNFAIFQNIFMVFVHWVLATVDPIFCSVINIKMYRGTPFPILDYFQLSLNCILVVDMAAQFFVGYAIEQSREVVLEPRSIRLRYLKTHFLFDLLGQLHVVIPIFFGHRSIISYFAKFFLVLRASRTFTILYLFRFAMKVIFKIKDSNLMVLQIILVSTASIHWWTTYFAVFSTVNEVMGWPNEFTWIKTANDGPTTAMFPDHDIRNDYMAYYLECLLIIMSHFYGAGQSPYREYSIFEMLTLCCVIIAGVCLGIYSIALVSEVFGTVNISTTKYEEMTNQIQDYVMTQKLPRATVNRLEMYYEYKFQRNFFWEQAILDSLSDHLQMEVVLYSCKHLIEKVDIFRGMSKAAVGTIISLLRQEIYLPGDKICSTDPGAKSNYHLISYGTASIYLDLPDTTQVEFGHFEDGDHLGDTGLKFKKKFGVESHTIAIELSEIFNISNEDVAYCMRMFPELRTKIKCILHGREEHCRHVLTADRSTHQDILTQLQTGKILERGKER